MFETADDLARMQSVMDASYARAGTHLAAVHEDRWKVTAADIVERMQGMCLLVLATSTSDGRPLTAPVDGFLIHGQLCFSSSPTSLRFRHLRARPAVSATHLPAEEFAVTVHGRARELDVTDADERIAAGLTRACIAKYGEGWRDWAADSAFATIEPDRMFAFRLDPARMTDEERDAHG